MKHSWGIHAATVTSLMCLAHAQGGGSLIGGGDDCNVPDAIAGQGSFFFDNSLATTGAQGQSESICYEFGTTAVINDVWFDWTADFTGTVVVDTCGSPTDTKIAAYPGAGCPTTGTALACNDDSCGWQSLIRFPVVSGQVYAIQVGLYPYASGGTGQLNIVEDPLPTVGGFNINSVSWFGGVTPGWGEISFDFLSGSTVAYVSVIDPAQPGAPGWFLENMPCLPSMDGRRYATTFDMSGYGGGPIEYYVTMTGFASAPTAGGGTIVTPTTGSTSYGANDLTGRPGGPADPGLVGPPPPNGTHSFDLPLGLSRAAWHDGMPDEPQGQNECAPTSAGNSLEWLNNKHGLDLPADRNEAGEIRDILKDATHMNTSPVTGTDDDDMIKGKLQFIAENDLPLTVEFMDDSLGDQTHAGLTATSAGTKPSFDWIFDQMQKGQDVELGMTWAARGGHWVTLTGAIELFGVQMLFYNDPDDGQNQTKFSILGTSDAGDPFPGYLELDRESSNSLDIAVAESPAPAPGVPYCPGDGVSPHTSCPCGNNNDSSGGAYGGCQWNGIYFPQGGFLDATGDASIANPDVILTATNVENNFGVFFGAANQTNGGNGNVFGDGLRCAGGGLVRLIPPTQAMNNTISTPVPVETLDQPGGAVAGNTRRYQYWFRTPMGPCGTIFNLTNGYEIAWTL